MRFLRDKHAAYIRKVSADTESFEYLVSQHLRMSGVYWGLTAMYLLGVDLKQEPSSVGMVDWVMSCYDPETGGFGGNVNHDAHILYTLSAIQILALYDEMHVLDREKIKLYVKSLQQSDGSFAGDKWGEIDTRFSYCALSILALLGCLEESVVDVAKAVDFVERCQNFDGGFGAVPGAESHAGQIFCCVGALSIAGALDRINANLLGWWLAERQCDSGGLNGRPEKQADVCYSWWILSALTILGRVHWIDGPRLCSFILQCQESDHGGVADRPGNMADVFHSFFGISGLHLLGYFTGILPELIAKGASADDLETSEEAEQLAKMPPIDATFALPVDVVQRLGLRPHSLPCADA